ncbi:pentatricopeptide repeat-containing protein, partial [Tanacetum coccineum]
MDRPNDKGKGIMLEDDSLVRKKRKALSSGNGIVTTENENPSFDYDSESDTDTNRGSDNHDDIQMNVSSESESEESDRSFDYLSDEDAELLEPCKIKLPEILHEAYMEALMKKLRGSKCGKKDPFTVVEKSGDKYPVYDEGTHWNMRKPHIRDKFRNAEKFKECLTYYALANGFSLWFYRSSKDKIIARCGQRKEKLKDPSKGKQRSYKKFPSETSVKTENRLPMEMLRQNDKGRNFISGRMQMALLNQSLVETTEGLIEAVKEVMPLAEHRQCARHIYKGFQKSYKGVEFRGLFWAASKASYPQMFNRIMDKIKRSNPDSHQYLLKKDPKTWSRAFFQEGSNCEAVENGFSECFNAVLLSVRHKPIVTLLESMRKILEQTKDQQRFWHVIPSGGNKFEVRRGSDAFKVDEKAKTCSCRMWQLSGLPCAHAIACIFKLNKMVEDYVPECFWKDMYIKAYSQYLKPMDGITFWPDCSHMSRVLGPIP